MKKKTATQKYIEDAVNASKEAHSGTRIEGVNVEMNLDVGEVATALAEAMAKQAEANKENSQAMKELASKLVPSKVYGINISSE